MTDPTDEELFKLEPTCAICEQSVCPRDSREWEQGRDICDACAQNRVVELEAALAEKEKTISEGRIASEILAAEINRLEAALAAVPEWLSPEEVTKPGDYFITREQLFLVAEEHHPRRAIRIKFPYMIGGREETVATFWAGWRFYGPIPPDEVNK